VNDEFGRLERVVLDVAPRLVAHGRIGLPIERADVTELATLQIKHRRVLLHSVVLVVDDSDVIAVLQGTVVIERSKACEIRPDRSPADPPVEVHDIRVIFLDEFGAPSGPVIGTRRLNIGEIIADWSRPS